MKDVFISYKSEEFDEANWVKTTLETNGISCWMAPMSISGGSSYAVEIPQAIRECKVFVLILSEKSQLSKWVPRELDQAINEEKLILPFMLENCPLKDDFNFYLTNVQRYAAYESKSNAMDKMVREIKALLGKQDTAEEMSVNNEPVENNVNAVSDKDSESGVSEPKSVEPTVVKHKPEKKKKASKAKSAKSKKVIIALVAVLVAVISAIAVFSPDDITIAGAEISSDQSWINLSDKTLTYEDIKAIEEMESVSSITLKNCVIPEVDLTGILSKATSSITLDNCGITDEILGKIRFDQVKVYILDLSNNPGITDISVLAPLSEKLTNLRINGCKVSDVSVLSDFARLYELEADDNSITDVSALSGCKDLRTVTLSGNGLSAFFEIDVESAVATVEIDDNKFTDLDFLKNALKLVNISAKGNMITDISGLKNSTLLSEVDLSGNSIADISVLSKSAGTLTKVKLSNNKIESFKALKDCSKLTLLYADNNKLTDVSEVGGFSLLERFSASDNDIASIKALENCKNLKEVNVSGNEITSMEALSSMSLTANLKINVSNNKITKLVLPMSQRIDLLVLYNNNFESSEITHCSGSEIAVDYDELIKITATENIKSVFKFYNYYIMDCPLDMRETFKKESGIYSPHFVTVQEYVDSKNQ